MPDETDAKVLQVISRQLPQYRRINGVVAKRLLVLLQPETLEPGRNVHSLLPADGHRLAKLIVPRILGVREYSARLGVALVHQKLRSPRLWLSDAPRDRELRQAAGTLTRVLA